MDGKISISTTGYISHILAVIVSGARVDKSFLSVLATIGTARGSVVVERNDHRG